MKVVGVTFRHQCKMYWFNANDISATREDHVIVETEQGIAYANVTVPTTEIPDERLPEDIKSIIRIATEEDDRQQALNERNEITAVSVCKRKVKEHEKEMKIIRAMYAFDRSKLTFYFTADGRVDFVALVKDLAREFRTRIELRQVGVRDETRLLGGIGICGRELCCATWLTDFVQVPIKAAKEQGLSLNTAKISGFCGRLMCCLKNEEETYRYLNALLPDMNQKVETLTGEHGIVKGINILKQKVNVLFGEGDEDKELREYHVSELRFEPSRKKEKMFTEEELQEMQKEMQLQQEEKIAANELTATAMIEASSMAPASEEKKNAGAHKKKHNGNRNGGGNQNGDGNRNGGGNRNENGNHSGNPDMKANPEQNAGAPDGQNKNYRKKPWKKHKNNHGGQREGNGAGQEPKE